MTTHTALIDRLRVFPGPTPEAAADAIEALEQQVAALTKEHEFACEIGADYRDKWMAAQAREAKLREALVDYDNQASEYDGRTSKELGDRIKSLRALPADYSALMERLKEERDAGYAEALRDVREGKLT